MAGGVLIPGDSLSNYQSFVGIIVAISGNVLISLALNCQKLAHKRLALQAESQAGDDEEAPTGRSRSYTRRVPKRHDFLQRKRAAVAPPERPKLERHRLNIDIYANEAAVTRPASPRLSPSTPRKSRVAFPQFETPGAAGLLRHDSIPEDSIPEDSPVHRPDGEEHVVFGNGRAGEEYDGSDSEDEGPEGLNETAYLKSKLWWLGFALMNVGEFGNFLSYAFAPASLVAPLGTFALVANCIFAPLMLKERFRKRDLFGILLAIIGAVTVVIASKSSDVRLDPDSLIKAITQRPFLIYTAITIAAAAFLAFLSETGVGQKHVFVDIGLCALFGGYTVLATKAFSTLLSLEWVQVFKEWITYPVILVLFGTGVGQIKYLNRALMKFDSKVVIPTQFVFFTLAAIIGSAILYRDFDTISFHRFVVFLYGCFTTFLGVFILTKTSILTPSPSSSPGVLSPTTSPKPFAVANLADMPTPTATTPLIARVQNIPTRMLRDRSSAASLGLSPGPFLLLAAGAGGVSSSPPVTSSALPIGRARSSSRGERDSPFGSYTGRVRHVTDPNP